MIYDIADNGNITVVAVGSNGTILVSADGGATWETVKSGVANTLHGVAYGYAFGLPRWVIVGENGMILTSPDAYSWSVQTPFTGNTLYSVAWAGVFLAVGAGGKLGLSADLGVTWELKSSGTLVDLYDITVDEGLYAIVGAEDTVVVGSLLTLDKEIVITETCYAAAAETSTGRMGHSAIEKVQAVDGYGWRHINGALVVTEGGAVQHDYTVESVGAYDLGVGLQGTMNHQITEAFSIMQSGPINAILRDAMAETARMTGNAVNDFRITRGIVETMVATETITAALGVTLLERLSLLAQPPTQGVFQRVTTESLTLRDSIVLSWLALLSELVTLTDTTTGKFAIAERLVERMTATGAIESRLLATMAVAASLVLSEQVAAGKGGSVAETVSLNAALLDQFKAYCLKIEAVTMAATPEMTLRLSMPITEAATVSDTSGARGVFRDLLAEGVAFELLFTAGGETYRGWVMNTENFGVTEYQNYPFNSLTQYNEVYLGANSNGVYKLVGATDAGVNINASLKTGVTIFPALTNVPEAFISFRSDGALLLKTVTDEKLECWYTVTGSENISRQRAKMGRGVKASYWQFELTNIAGASLELESLELVPVILSRKI